MGSDAAAFISQRYADLLFVSVSGINAKGTTSKIRKDYLIKKAFQRQSNMTILMIDSNKFNETDYYSSLSFDDIDMIMTVKPLPEEIRKAITDRRIHDECLDEEQPKR